MPMTIIDTLEQASNNAGFKGLSFANLQEFNSFMGSFNFLDFPRCVIVPFTLNGTLGSNNRKDKVIVLRGWALTRISQDTNDWRSIQLEKDYIQPMRAMAEKLLIQVANSDLTNPEAVNISYSILPEYMFLKDHLFGVSFSINWPVMGNVC